MTRSWDFWDTLVTRAVIRPSEIFDLVERASGVEGFSAARVEAEKKSRAGVLETTLERIYEFMPFDRPIRERTMAMEVEFEVDLASPVLENVSAFSRDDIVISDMYLNSNTLRRIAKSCGLAISSERLFVSSEHAATKHSGALFRVAKQRYEFSHHTGDNWQSDIVSAARQGINARHFSFVAQNGLEREWSAIATQGRFIAGALRAARMAKPTYCNAADWDVYSQIVGPLLVRFVDWVVKQVQVSGIRNIFFLSRDGQILHKIAEELIRARGLNIRCRYIFASRQALHLPGHISIEQSESWLLDNTAMLSLRVIADRIAAPVERVAEIARKLFSAAVDKNLDEQERRLLSKVIRDREFQDLAKSRSDEVFGAAVEYFRGVGLFRSDGEDVAIVDVGWLGRIQQSLENLSIKAGFPPERIHGLYIGLGEKPVFPNGERLKGFLFDPYRKDSNNTDNWINRYRGMLEYFLRADHPSVVGYVAGGSGDTGVLFGPSVAERERNDIRLKQEAIMRFVEKYCKIEQIVGPALANDLGHSEITLRRFLERPTFSEARVFVNGQHTEQQMESDFVPLVKLVRFLQLFGSRPKWGLGIWPEGSCALSGLLWFYRIRRVAGGLRRRLMACWS
jgi:predicted HAD superfamily hydrolase